MNRVASVFMFLIICFVTKGQPAIPHLKKQGTATQLIVHNQPFLMRGGELGNSSSSSIAYMNKIWPTLEQMNLNTLLVPVYWELIEPVEGKFDFALVDQLITDARSRDMKLVFLWFGSWKNSMSCYVPTWVKNNQKRFPRAQDINGQSVEILSPFNNENLQADKKAFISLMKNIKTVDAKDNTVIMVQVENEIGMLPDARDYCTEATTAYNSQVPADFLTYLVQNKAKLKPEFAQFWNESGSKTEGTWAQVFGNSKKGEEVFMAWNFAKYTQEIAKAGKEVYALPMYINAALNREGYAPGDYPSAGPLPHLMDVWKAGAPAIDFLSPDIYFPNFVYWAKLYDRGENAFFIPEAKFNEGVDIRMLYSIGEHDAMGFSPFSIESTNTPAEERITKAYGLIQQLEPEILKHQGDASMVGFQVTKDKMVDTIPLGGYTFIIKHEYNLGWSPGSKDENWPTAGGLIICTAPGEYIVAGTGIEIRFISNDKDKPHAGIDIIDEGSYVNGEWIPVRRLNGDQTHQGRHLRIEMFNYDIQKVKLYAYE